MKNWTIGKRITLAFLVVIGITAAVGSFAYSRIIAIRSSAASIVDDALPGVYTAALIEEKSKQRYVDLLTYVLTSNAQDRAELDVRMKKTGDELGKIIDDYEKTITTPKDRE